MWASWGYRQGVGEMGFFWRPLGGLVLHIPGYCPGWGILFHLHSQLLVLMLAHLPPSCSSQ